MHSRLPQSLALQNYYSTNVNMHALPENMVKVISRENIIVLSANTQPSGKVKDVSQEELTQRQNVPEAICY
jgi:hypothetical protein